MNGGPLGITRSLAAANPVLLPKPEPRTMREQVVVPAIRRRDVAGVQRPGIRDRIHALQPLDFRNGPLGVHPSQYGPESQEGQSAGVSPKTLTDGLGVLAVGNCGLSIALSPPRSASKERTPRFFDKLQQVRREAAQECSPWRKPWVAKGKNYKPQRGERS